MLNKKLFLTILIISLALVVACQPKPNSDPPSTAELNFQVEFLPQNNKTIDIIFSIKASNTDLVADKDFNASMLLTGPDDEKRASFIINQLPAMNHDEALEMVNWHGQLEPGQYSLEWGADGYGKLQTTFEVFLNPGEILEIRNQKFIDENPS